ncbi:CaiB/BaiF CoA transferase family protein [Shimia aestuarii]|uniref:Alpha-methylacyl-CoA racemase n=1 Tax=Shimia aestuarii TaxID=254406 RepID=A0A1I4SHD1_9RHOB|nr:CaiB/BaiF CoA-transferase family protein [Shimia aestuarii]SFM63741.1 alpha-methylacyl-CoA racemase [Shimia aestuarii]
MTAPRPLSGIRVLDLSRLAPGPYATMLLADMGAEVITVGAGSDASVAPVVARGKTLIRLDLKSPEGRDALHHLARHADVLVEGFRPGVAARIGAGADELCALNPRLVYCSLTGYGQDGPRAQEAGHDINYLAVSGVLGAMGPPDAPPSVPLNLVADFGGGSLFAVIGILAALTERVRTGKGRVIDATMVDGCLSMMAMHAEMWGTDFMPARGKGLLDGGAPFYRCYECADGGYMAVGALEPAFFTNLWKGLEFDDPMPNYMDPDIWPALEARFARAFASRNRAEWTAVFEGADACVTPVLAPDEVRNDAQIAHRLTRAPGTVPLAPRFDGDDQPPPPRDMTDRTEAVLIAAGLSADTVGAVLKGNGAATSRSLQWPPRRPKKPTGSNENNE